MNFVAPSPYILSEPKYVVACKTSQLSFPFDIEIVQSRKYREEQLTLWQGFSTCAVCTLLR